MNAPAKKPRIIEEIKADLAALWAKYEERANDSELSGCGIQLLWRVHPDPTTHIHTVGKPPLG